jgi:GTP pyrophosphokinase
MVTVEVFEKAILFAVKAHKGQRRKGDGRPYILHPMSVLRNLYDVKESKNMYFMGTASMLHDVVENCGVSLKKIAKKFGYAVAALVEELTLDKQKYETIGKAKYLCQEVIKMSSYALCIKLCDRLDNVRDMKKMSNEFRNKYKAETWEIVNTLERDRKLTKTQKKLVKLIKKEIK